MIFADKAHLDFYEEKTAELKPDCYLNSFIYTIGMCEETRRRFNEMYNRKERIIILDTINEAWQTSTSRKVTRLAFQLFTDGTPTAFTFDGNGTAKEDISECEKYSVSDIFCCGYAPFFVEAIKLRYPEYFREYYKTRERSDT